jgi:hypothetical protein
VISTLFVVGTYELFIFTYITYNSGSTSLH